MEPRFKFYLKQAGDTSWTLLADEPEGWQELSEEITRDYSIHGLLVDTKVTLTFTGDGYTYVKNVFDCQSFCSEIQIMIEEACSETQPYNQIFEGLIKMGDLKFDMNKCTCEAPVIDNSYFARIKNNVDIEAKVNVGKSKSGNDITAATMNVVKMFDPTNGNYEAEQRKAYRLFEIAKFLVAFMSDGDVEFASDLLDTGDFSGMFLTNGAHLKDANSANYQNPDIGALSWKIFVDELYKIGNVGFMIETGGPKPVLRLEGSDYFYGTTITDTFNYANGVTKKIKTDQLYAYVNFGSSKTINDVPALSYPDDIDFLGWKDEKFHLTGQCNIETTLELKGEFIRSSNVIQDIVMGISANPNEAYDEDFIFVSAEPTGGGNYQAIQYDVLNIAPPYQYNGNITNDKIALRFFGAIPSSIVSWLGDGGGLFLSKRTSNESHSVAFSVTSFGQNPILYDNDYTAPNFDDDNAYGNGTTQGSPVSQPNSIFIAQSSGVYVFKAYNKVVAIHHLTVGKMWMHHANSSGGILESADTGTVYQTNGPPSGLMEFYIEKRFYLNAGDKVYTQLSLTSIPQNTLSWDFEIYADSYFECVFTLSGGGIFEEYNTEDFKAIQYTFDYPISNSRWNTIRTNAKNQLAFNIDGLNDNPAWIDKISYSKKDSMASITLIGKQQKKNC